MKITYSIVAPIYNEAETLTELHRRIREVMDANGEPLSLRIARGKPNCSNTSRSARCADVAWVLGSAMHAIRNRLYASMTVSG